MPPRTMAGLDETLQTLIESAERCDWDQLDQIATKLIPALTAVCEAPPLKAGDSPKATELLSKLQTAIDRCLVRQAQISPLLDALSRKTPEQP
jgi:hypothetical protein